MSTPQIALTDAFDIPDRVLNSTIGKYDGNIYEGMLYIYIYILF